jgi:hypothetical protein
VPTGSNASEVINGGAPEKDANLHPLDRRGGIVEIVGPVTGSVWGLIDPAVKPANAALLLALCGRNVKAQTRSHPQYKVP